MIKSAAGPDLNLVAGKSYQVGDELGKALCESGSAHEVEPAKERPAPASKAPTRTAAGPRGVETAEKTGAGKKADPEVAPGKK